MPVVFVHGVATRQTPDYVTQARQRDALFQRLVLPAGAAAPFDPDWGSHAVTFDPNLAWIPEPKGAEAWGAGDAGGDLGLSRIASKKPEVAIDLAFQTGLSVRAEAAAKADASEPAISAQDLAAFEAAVKYLEGGADKDAFDPKRSDNEFLTDLADELKAHSPPPADQREAMSIAGDALAWLGRGVKSLVDPVANASSDAILRVVRRPLSRQVALFLGDIFVYLRWRETAGAGSTVKRIFEPIADSLVAASKTRKPGDPLIVVGHSLGGVVLYDMFNDPDTMASITQRIGSELVVDTWVTVGSQPALFADMGLYSDVKKAADNRFPCPKPVHNWFNVYDYTDVFSFSCEPLFDKVLDFNFNSVTSLLSAHSAYFQRPSFYSRLRARLKQAS